MSERPELEAELADTLRRWVRKAEEDLRACQRLTDARDEWLYRPATFHAQQCVEKYLKALLVARRCPVPRTHDLERLLVIIATEGTLPSGLPGDDTMALLNRYAVATRYPDDIEPVSAEEAIEALRAAQAVRTAVRAVLPVGV